LKSTAIAIVRLLQNHGFAAYWVGGCVRDFLLGRKPGDYDIATNALPAQVEEIFKRTIPVGRKFGVMIVVENGHQFQVATFRAEADYQDGRRPSKVSFGDPTADALRRDFTINGLFYDPVHKKLHDWVGGEADLRARIIRTIGPPAERFAEDHLRLLRAVRLAVQLDFEIESATCAAIKASAAKIKTISAERIRDELIKIFAPATQQSRPSSRDRKAVNTPSKSEIRNPKSEISPAARALDLLHQSGLLQHIVPELEATVHCAQSPDYHPEGSVFNHLKLMLEYLPPDADPSLPWAVLLHDIAKPRTASTDPRTGAIHFYGHEKIGADMAEAILEGLRFPRKQIEAIAKAVRYHMQFKDALEMRKSTLRRLLMRPTFPLELQLHRLDCLGSHRRLDVYEFLAQQAKELEKKPEIIPPLLKGEDLIALGMQPGPAMGALLDEIREKQLQDELKTKAEAKKFARSKLKDAERGP